MGHHVLTFHVDGDQEEVEKSAKHISKTLADDHIVHHAHVTSAEHHKSVHHDPAHHSHHRR
jgi:hypothetical protein